VLPLVVLACSSDDPAPAAKADAGSSSSSSSSSSGGSSSSSSSSSSSGGDAGDPTVTINFGAKVGSEAWSCTKQYLDLGTTKAKVAPTDLRFYVHDVRLIRSDDQEVALTLTVDGKWQSADVALIDLEDGTGTCTEGNPDVNAKIVGTAPKAAYKGLAFKIGVPFAKNHGNPTTAPAPLNLTQMLWSWQAGYRFLKIDTQPVDTGAGAPPPFFMHIGSTDCVGDPEKGVAVTSCGRPNRFEVRLPAFDAATQKVVFDYAALVAGADLTLNGGGPPGCMSGTTDPECAPVFPKMGLDITTGAPSGTQSVFKAE